ncbi:PqqD family protein [Qipengyuania oceanensis]|uniref:PqqD family peptide modification chaperone n=1 Tax=Qipengyuania oceanensis TaxID=1463597 RepID=A0A844YI01_9SPHN|nr:PqqD family protein [Qipengyuania oceanensis]MXO62959.1 PqqD family peptide modification chaperone [Qipengyuania oceanensis]
MATPRKLTDNFVATTVDDEIVIVDMAGGELFSLKGTARAVWEAIDGDTPVDAIAQAMAARYDVTPDEAGADIAALVGELEAAGLVAGRS